MYNLISALKINNLKFIIISEGTIMEQLGTEKRNNLRHYKEK